MDEAELIAAIAARLKSRSKRVLSKIGDDAAVVKALPIAVTSIDTMVDSVHFHLKDMSPETIGKRALAGATSDLAAMGATVGEAYLAITIPQKLDPAEVIRLVDGADQLAAELDMTIAGGDISRGSQLSVAITVNGWANSPTELVTRGGAQVGDLVGVTGQLGGSGAGLAIISNLATGDQQLIDRYCLPKPRIKEGQLLAEVGATAMIDVSDGIATDASHLGQESNVLLSIDLDKLSLAPGVKEVCEQLAQDPYEFAATAGEDYELCFCIKPELQATVQAQLSVSWIGTVIEGEPGARFYDSNGERKLRGYDQLA